MADRTGKCINFGLCSKADTREIIPIAGGGDFSCPECGKPLTEASGGAAGPGAKKPPSPVKMVAAGALGMLLIAGIAYKFLEPGKDDKKVDNSQNIAVQNQNPQNPQQPNQQMPDQTLPNQQMPNQQMPNQQMPNQQMPNQQMPNQQMPNQQMPNQQMPNQQMPNQQMPNQMPTQQMPNQRMPNQRMPNRMPTQQMPQQIPQQMPQQIPQQQTMPRPGQQTYPPAPVPAPPPVPAPVPVVTTPMPTPAAGTVMTANLLSPIDTRTANVGDRYTAKIEDGPYAGGILTGTIRKLEKKKNSVGLELSFKSISVTGSSVPVNMDLVDVSNSKGVKGVDEENNKITGKSSNKKLGESTGIGAGAGALIGGLTHGVKGALIGGGVGAGAGFVVGKTMLAHAQDVEARPRRPPDAEGGRPLGRRKQCRNELGNARTSGSAPWPTAAKRSRFPKGKTFPARNAARCSPRSKEAPAREVRVEAPTVRANRSSRWPASPSLCWRGADTSCWSSRIPTREKRRRRRLHLRRQPKLYNQRRFPHRSRRHRCRRRSPPSSQRHL